MKKILTTLTFSFFAFFIVSFAGNYDPGKQVYESFKKDFPHAMQVKWQMERSILQVARFTQNGRAQLAYYKENGEFLGQTWLVELNDLPRKVKEEALHTAGQVDIKSVYIFLPPEGYPYYYITLESNGKTIIKEIDSNGHSSFVSKKRIPII